MKVEGWKSADTNCNQVGIALSVSDKAGDPLRRHSGPKMCTPNKCHKIQKAKTEKEIDKSTMILVVFNITYSINN